MTERIEGRNAMVPSTNVGASSDWPYPRLVAHRGGGTLAPENTLEAIDTAASLGRTMVEFDAKLSADDIVFLLHDDDVARTSDGRGAAQAMPYRQLAALDAGAWFSPAFAGARMPTLAEAAARCIGHRLYANVEIKPCLGRDVETGRRVAQQTLACWADSDMPALLSSFSFAALEAAAEAAASLSRGMLYERVPADWREQARALECLSLHADYRYLDERLVGDIKDAGLRVLAYTVNAPDIAARLWRWGVDAICTDRIDARFPEAEVRPA